MNREGKKVRFPDSHSDLSQTTKTTRTTTTKRTISNSWVLSRENTHFCVRGIPPRGLDTKAMAQIRGVTRSTHRPSTCCVATGTSCKGWFRTEPGIVTGETVTQGNDILVDNVFKRKKTN